MSIIMTSQQLLYMSCLFLFVCTVPCCCQNDTTLYYSNPVFLNTSKLSCLSCNSRCGLVSQPLKNNLNYKFCSCDALCMVYGDCCPDYNQLCTKNKTPASTVLPEVQPSYCYSNGNKAFLLLNHCNYSTAACEVDLSEITSRIPVTDVNTGLHYVNYACALCNNISNVKQWKAELYPDKQNDSIKNMLNNSSSLTLRVNNPVENSSKRWCIPEKRVIRKCEQDYADKPVNKMCLFGHRQYVNVGRAIYFNPYCAFCNGAKQSDLECYAARLAMIGTRRLIYSSYKLLFKISGSSGISLAGLCLTGEVYVPAQGKCIKTRRSKEDNKLYILFNITLQYQEYKIPGQLPMQLAGKLISKLEVKYSSVSFKLGKTGRNWINGYDVINIYVFSKQENFTHLLSMGTQLTNFIKLGLSTAGNVTLGWFISGSNLDNLSSCNKIQYDLNKVVALNNGSVALPEGHITPPGRYQVINKTFTGCVILPADPLEDILGWVTLISMTLSVICLVVHITLNYIYRPKKRWRTSGLAGCLLVTCVTFLLTPVLRHDDKACHAAGMLLHLSFLSSFTWMNFISIDIYLALSTVQVQQSKSQRRKSCWKYFMSFIPAVIILVLTVVIERLTVYSSWKARYGDGFLCWIEGRNVLLYLFVLPGAISIVITVIFTMLCAYKLFYLWRTTHNATAKERNYFMMFIKLAAMTGIGWCIGFVAVPTQNTGLFIVFVLFTATQGIWILLVVWGGRCRKMMRKLKRRESSISSRTKDTPLTGTSV